MKKVRLMLMLALCGTLMLAPTCGAVSASPKYVSTLEAPEQTTPAPSAEALPVNLNGVEAQVVEEVNTERARRNLPALRVDAELTRAAAVRAAEIARKFSHTRPDGSAWSTVSASAYGENIAMGQRTVDKVMAAWMSSQGHRENILRPSYGSIGVCAVTAGGVVYWVQLFGK